MRQAYLLATASTRFDRRPDVGFRAFADEVVRAVLADAQLGTGTDKAVGNEIETAWFGNCLMHAWGQPNIRGQVSLVDLIDAGVLSDRLPVTNVESACATGSLALHGAVKDVRSGEAEVSLALAIEKMVLPGDRGDPAVRAMSFELLAGSTDNLSRDRLVETYRIAGRAAGVEFTTDPGRSMFMDTYAVQALLHMQRYGTTQKQIAAACAKNHNYGAANPLAQYRFETTAEKVLDDVLITYPFTRSMCAPVGDGAAAAIVVSGGWLAGQPEAVRSRAVRVRATAAAGGSYRRTADEPSLTQHAGQKAFRRAGLAPGDIDVAEVHDATSFGEIFAAEMLGFCPPGQGGAFVADGATGPGGTVPMNTSGGLVSKGHPIGATGLSMTHEIATQLRGEAGPRQVPDARIGLVENGGGVLGLEEAACAVTVLERVA